MKNRYTWIGKFWYPNGNATVYVGFYKDKQYFTSSPEHPLTFGDIIATNSTKYYKRDTNTKHGWYESAFEEVNWPTDPSLTYYIRPNNVKFNTRKSILINT